MRPALTGLDASSSAARSAGAGCSIPGGGSGVAGKPPRPPGERDGRGGDRRHRPGAGRWLAPRRRRDSGLGRRGGRIRGCGHVRGRSAGGPQRERPALLRDPGGTALRPVEGQRPPHQPRLALAGRCPVPDARRVPWLAVLRRQRGATGGRSRPVGELPLRDARRRAGTGLRHRTAEVQAPATTGSHGPVAVRAGRELRHADRPAQPARGGQSAAAAAFPPGHPATGRRTFAARRRRLQAPRGPDRRPALRLDRGPVGAARAGPLPGPRPASASGWHTNHAAQHSGRHDHRACPARAAPVIQPPAG